ncbi:MAG: 30S ribosomal protein S21 [Bacteriovoracaceae bacterium]|nr:30S ribosomal protein S21 [Bacteriovoracaceae bacterium]
MSRNNEIVKIVIDEKFRPESAIKKFKRLCDQYGVTKEYKRRRHHTKPSDALREKMEQAQKRRLKLQRKKRTTKRI